jgi:protein translocase SEC61 complex gamma subunit
MELRLRERLSKFRKIWIVSRKPDKDEFKSTGKIVGVGIAVIGIIGFILYLASVVIPGLIG